MIFPTLQEVEQARDRYRRHLIATEGEQSVDAFAASPYFVSARGQPWAWHTRWMTVDCVILAQNDIRIHGGLKCPSARKC
jgi:hypothetical protein